jgi:uridine kinase
MLIRTKANTFIIRFSQGKESSFIKGTPLFEILEFQRLDKDPEIVLARVNNVMRSLHESLDENCTLEWIKIQTPEGRRSYQQTLCLLLIRASRELFPQSQLYIDHSLGKGLYCDFLDSLRLNPKRTRKIADRIRELIQNNEPIIPEKIPRKKALKHLKSMGEDPASVHRFSTL